MSVRVRLFAAAREAAGTNEYSAAPGPLADVLAAGPPGLAAVLPRCSYLLDGVRAGAAAAVPDGATVDVLPPFAGG